MGGVGLRSCDVHRRLETATIWQGHDWGHRRTSEILFFYKSMVYDVNVVATRPTTSPLPRTSTDGRHRAKTHTKPRRPRKLNLDGNAASHRALRLMRQENSEGRSVLVRSRRYLNNIVGAPGKVWRFQRVKIPHRQGASHPTGNRALGLWR